MKVAKFDKHLKKVGGYIGQNVVENNNKDEDNSPKTLNDKNHQASSQKFWQLILLLLLFIYSFDFYLPFYLHHSIFFPILFSFLFAFLLHSSFSGDSSYFREETFFFIYLFLFFSFLSSFCSYLNSPSLYIISRLRHLLIFPSIETLPI